MRRMRADSSCLTVVLLPGYGRSKLISRVPVCREEGKRGCRLPVAFSGPQHGSPPTAIHNSSSHSKASIATTGKPTTNPPAEFKLDAGDVLVRVGSHQQLDAAEALLAP